MVAPACKNCRLKRVKCDGIHPICGSCGVLQPSTACTYGSPQREKIFRTKEACTPCRRKKKRCDAVRPTCGTCQVSRTKGELCFYEVETKTEKPRMRQSQRALASRSSSQAVVKLGKGATPLLIAQFSLKSDSFRFNSTLSFPDILLDPLKPTIIQNPSISLKDLDDPFAFALSGVSSDDLNMRFRVIFLSQRFIYGVYFSPPKFQALLFGDVSSPILHPFFIHFANLVGCQLYQERERSYFLLAVQAGHLLKAQAALKSMSEDNDPLAFAQANFYFGIAYTYARSAKLGKKHFKRAVEIIHRNNIRFVYVSTLATSLTTSSSLVDPLDLERIYLLTQMLCIEVTFYLIGQPATVLTGFQLSNSEGYASRLPMFYSEIFLPDERTPNVSADLEQQFRYELPEAFPGLTGPVISRVQSTLFIKDTCNLIAWFKQQDSNPSQFWLSTCQTFMSHLTVHIAEMKLLVAESPDVESRLAFQYCYIVSVTSYAQILFVLARSPTSSVASSIKLRDECSHALSRVIAMVEKVNSSELLTLGGLLGICWSRALALFGTEQWEIPSPSSNDRDSTCLSTDLSPTNLLKDGDEPARLPSGDQSGLGANIARIAQLNEQFIADRYIPGTSSLCARLAEQNIPRRVP